MKLFALALTASAAFLAGTAQASNITWNLAGSGAWDISTANWTGDSTTFTSDGTVNVTFNTSAAATITIQTGGVNPASTTANNSAGTLQFSGGMITGAGGLTKSGAGTLQLNAVNSYTGKTIVQGGTLRIGNNTATYLSLAGANGPLGAPTGANATIDLYNGTTFRVGTSNPRVDPQVTDRTLNLADTSGAGTVTLRFNDNDTAFGFGAVTATGTGAKLLDLYLGTSGNGDRESLYFNGAISDVTGDGSPLSLQVTFRSQSGAANYVSLAGANTFTGPIALVQYNSGTTGYLVIGGVMTRNSNLVGTGTLDGGTYAGTITLCTSSILYYDSTTAQTLSGVISGPGAVTMDAGSGTLTLSGANTYSGNTTVNGGTLILDTTGSLNFVLGDTTNNKLTGAGTATLNGSFTIDTSAVTVSAATWTLVDITSQTYGGTFGVTGFTGPVGTVFTQVDGQGRTWTFDTSTGVLTVSAKAVITAFGIPGYAGVINQSTHTITLTLPGLTYSNQLATLSPTYTVTSGTCPQPNDGVTPPTPTFAAGPVTYTVTDGANVNSYTAMVVLTYGLNESTYLGIQGTSYLNPIANLMGQTPAATGIQADNIDYHGSGFSALPGTPGPNTFSILWEGYFDVLAAGGHGTYTFGTSSDDGSVLYLDLNSNGSFADSGELIVNNNQDQGNTAMLGTVTLNVDSVHMVIGYYQNGGGYDMSAGWAAGTQTAFSALALINGTSGVFFPYDPHPQTVPVGLMAVGGDGQVTLSWAAFPGATAYHLWRSTTPGGNPPGTYETEYTVSSGLTYTDTAVVNGTPYYYVVTAVTGAGESGKSAEASATPSGPDAALSTVVASLPSCWADGVSFSTVTVTVLNSSSTPLVGETVTLASSRAAGLDTIMPASGVSDANGQVVFTVASTTVTDPGTPAVFTATAGTVALSTTVSVSFVASPTPLTSYLQATILQTWDFTGSAGYDGWTPNRRTYTTTAGVQLGSNTPWVADGGARVGMMYSPGVPAGMTWVDSGVEMTFNTPNVVVPTFELEFLTWFAGSGSGFSVHWSGSTGLETKEATPDANSSWSPLDTSALAGPHTLTLLRLADGTVYTFLDGVVVSTMAGTTAPATAPVHIGISENEINGNAYIPIGTVVSKVVAFNASSIVPPATSPTLNITGITPGPSAGEFTITGTASSSATVILLRNTTCAPVTDPGWAQDGGSAQTGTSFSFTVSQGADTQSFFLLKIQ